jgi:hypothetical protein
MLRYHDLPAHSSEVLDLTSLTVDEFTVLVPPFEAAFLGYMAEWTLHGQRRQSRRYTTYKNCPLPTPEDRRMAFQRFGGAKTSGRPVSGKLGGGSFYGTKSSS